MPSVQERLAAIETNTEEANNKLARIETLLQGNVEAPGLVVRLDRTEQTLKAVRKLFWLVLAIALPAAGKAFWP